MRRVTAASVGRPRSASSASLRTSRSVASGAAAARNGGGGNDNNGSGAPLEEDTMTCMSVVEEGSQIAFACYNEETNEILLEHSHANGHDTQDVVESFLGVARPNLILISNKIAGNTPLLHLLTRPPPNVEDELEGNQNNNGTTTSQESADRPSTLGGTTTPTATNNTPRNTSRTGQRSQSSVPYRLLKSGAFDLKVGKSLILQRLRVLSLLRRSDATRHSDATAPSFHHPRSDNNGRVRQFPRSTSHLIAPSSPYHALASIVDFESPVQIRALGSLISFLQSTIFRLEEGETVTVNTIRHAESSMFVRINAATLRALYIFATEHHPLMAKGQGHAKEGSSLFTLLDRTKSKVGRQCLREWMLKPLMDRHAICRRQDGVELFLRPEYQTSSGVLLNLLEQIGAVDKILLRMQKCHTAPMDFLVLSRTLSAAYMLCTTLTNDFCENLQRILSMAQENNHNNHMQTDDTTAVTEKAQRFLSFLQHLLERCCIPVLRDLQERITSIVDEEATIVEGKNRVVIQSGFHEELDNAKENMQNIEETTLRVVGNQILERHPELQHLTVILRPQIGFLIKLDKTRHPHEDETNQFPTLPEDFDFIFSLGDDAFFKNGDMIQLDNEIGDLDAFITDTESFIVSELEEDILDCESELRSTFGALAELDCILAFASCADDLKYTRPQLVDAEQCCIRIQNGRHPLQELIVDNGFVANDSMVDSANRVNIITGPNFSGKSCYTRQVGMLVYMAHIGCFLPCERAMISITDQIFARISTVETCAVPQSSFQLDLTQMATIFRRSTPTSLVLIDEFGKGTNPASGIALLTAAIKKLSRLKAKVICTTHFLEIFTLGLLRDGRDGIKVLRMAVHVPRSRDPDDDAAPLFKLEEGVASSSAGLVCAETAGVNQKVIGRATEIITALREGGNVKPIQAIMHSSAVLPPAVKDVLRMFLGVDSWANASDQELDVLYQKLERI